MQSASSFLGLKCRYPGGGAPRSHRGSRYRLRQQVDYGRAGVSALQWGTVGCTKAPRKSGENAGKLGQNAGERRMQPGTPRDIQPRRAEAGEAALKGKFGDAAERMTAGCSGRWLFRSSTEG
jgi:hypothetical protein